MANVTLNYIIIQFSLRGVIKDTANDIKSIYHALILYINTDVFYVLTPYTYAFISEQSHAHKHKEFIKMLIYFTLDNNRFEKKYFISKYFSSGSYHLYCWKL